MPKKKTQKKPAATGTVNQEVGRIVAGMYQDSQEVRISAMNRIRDVVRKKIEDLPTNKTEGKKKDDEKYKKLYTDAKLKQLIKTATADGKLAAEESKYITTMIELKEEAEKTNAKFKKLMEEYIAKEPVYDGFLQHIRGISTVLSTKLIKNFGNCERFEYICSLWKICGFHVIDGHAPKKTKGQKLDFNPKLRVLVWTVGESFIKQRTPLYRELYDSEKARQVALMTAKAPNAPQSLKHADLRARRKMVKIFLSHYYVAARELNGLPVSQPYVQDKLQHKNIIPWQEAVKRNKARKAEKAEEKEEDIDFDKLPEVKCKVSKNAKKVVKK